MPDNLTQKFLEDLKNRSRDITTPTPMSAPDPQTGIQTAGQTLWESLGAPGGPQSNRLT